MFNFQNLIILIALLFILFIMFIYSSFHIIINSNIKGTDVCITLNIKYLFNIINIHRQIYPPTNKKRRKKNKREGYESKHKRTLLAGDIISLYRLIIKVKIVEIYSNIEFGSTYINLTSFTYLLINIIYGNVASCFNPDKIYLGVKPNFVENYFLAKTKIHIKPSVKDIIKVIIALRKVKKINQSNIKDGDINESDRVNSESYGDNS